MLQPPKYHYDSAHRGASVERHVAMIEHVGALGDVLEDTRDDGVNT